MVKTPASTPPLARSTSASFPSRATLAAALASTRSTPLLPSSRIAVGMHSTDVSTPKANATLASAPTSAVSRSSAMRATHTWVMSSTASATPTPTSGTESTRCAARIATTGTQLSGHLAWPQKTRLVLPSPLHPVPSCARRGRSASSTSRMQSYPPASQRRK